MGLPVEVNNLMLGSLGGYTVGRSLRFRSSASAYLNRTPASAGNRKTWTWSGWIKLGALTSGFSFMDQYSDANNQSQARITASGVLRFYDLTSNVFTTDIYWTPVYRDPSAWYHIMLVADTSQATNTNRVKFYVNGTQVTSTSSATWPSQNTDLRINLNAQHFIGQNGAGGEYADGYLAEVNFIDGQALTPSSFGAYDTNGVWQPKKYSGTYGTNGFYLPFSNTTSTTTLVQDSSGNGNNWTPNNISLTAGTTYDSMIDSPTNAAGTSTGIGNYAVLNPLNTQISGSAVLQNANLQLNATSATYVNSKSTITASSLNCYCEMTVTTQSGSNGLIGIGVGNSIANIATGDGSYITYRQNGQIISYPGNTLVATVSSYTQGDIIGMTATSSQVAFYKNNSLQGTYNHNLSGDFFVVGMAYNATNTAVVDFNFGQRPFSYTPPSGFKALNTYNLPAPSIANGAQYMAATLWTGDGAQTRSITGNLFQPDLVWMKLRSGTTQVTQVYDSVRGVGGGKGLSTAETYAEGTMNGGYLDSDYGYISSLDSSGFSVNDGAVATTGGWVNYSARTYVGWQWKAGGTGVTNNSGTITSTVSANTTAGFSIATFTGTGANATVGHGLGVAPSMIIFKDRTNGSRTADQWPVYHSSLGATQQLYLYSTQAAGTASTVFNNTAPTSSVFSIGTWGGINYSTDAYVAYCFAAVRGFSAFGSYTGNGSSDGPFIYTGFRPRFVLVKCSSNSTSSTVWTIWDTSRNTYNASVNELYPNSSSAEGIDSSGIDILSNGFKPKRNSEYANLSGWTYVYAAFAEHPFQASRAR